MSYPGYLEDVVADAMEFAAEASSEVHTALGRLIAILQKPDIDLMKLRGCVLAHGLPLGSFCAPSLRTLVWKLLLGTLPGKRADWASALEAQRASYAEYVQNLVEEPELITCLRYGVRNHRGDGSADSSPRGPVERSPVTDHPLAPPASPSSWRRYWDDAEIFDQVNKDVYRTRPELEESFFSQSPNSRTVTARGRCLTGGSLEQDSDSPTSPRMHAFRVANVVDPVTHHDRLCRLLFIFSKLNFGYVQGMNEMMAVLYYTFYSDPHEGHFVESDTFFAFTALMAEQRDIFCKSMDECRSGMIGRMDLVGELLKRQDPELVEYMQEIGLKTSYFALRWIMLLFAYEFDLELVQVLWDAILSDQSPTVHSQQGSKSLIHYMCIAMVVRVREVLLEGDFADCMNLLQHYPAFDPREVIRIALRIRRGISKSRSGMSTASDDGLRLIASPDEQEPPSKKSGDKKMSDKKKKPFPLAVVVNLMKRRFHKDKAVG